MAIEKSCSGTFVDATFADTGRQGRIAKCNESQLCIGSILDLQLGWIFYIRMVVDLL